MFIKKFSVIFFILLCVITVLYFFRVNRWEVYYKNKINKPPNPFVVKAVELIKSKKNNIKRDTAIDFGAGVGNETLYLLKKGYAVTAIDNQSIAFKMMKSRKETEPYLDKLNMIVSDFEKLDWNTIPLTDLFLANFSMPFINPKKFKTVWNDIVKNIKEGGYFVGQFFTPDYVGFDKSDMENMTFLSRIEIVKLFDNFVVEYINRVDEPGKSGTGCSVIARYFEVIARKKHTFH